MAVGIVAFLELDKPSATTHAVVNFQYSQIPALGHRMEKQVWEKVVEHNQPHGCFGQPHEEDYRG
jgi:hypothetical protein